MAVVLGRFLRFYPGYTAEAVLLMPWSRFAALLRAISPVQANERLQALETLAFAVHPGERAEGYKTLVARLQLEATGTVSGSGTTSPDALVPGSAPFIQLEAESGSIEAERARQRAAAERLEAERLQAQ